jgi:DNA-binding transcriptional LysR family regulator
MKLELDLLKVLVTIAERGGFTHAARALHRTQSAVSMQMKRLENAVGVPLFVRRGRTIQVNRDGEALIGYARRMLALGDEALGAVAKTDCAGTVRMGSADDHYTTRVLPRMLTRFLRTHRHARVELRTGLTVELLERLGADYDLVLGMHAAGSSRGFVIQLDRPTLATGATSKAHREYPLPLALFPEGCLFRRWATRALDDAGRAWQCAYVSPSYGALVEAVRAGLAVSVFKRSTLAPGLRPLGKKDGFPVLPDMEIALHRSQDASRAAHQLAEHLVERFRRNST